jgi:glyoxylase-like metal-dependent hydrolase (beta-lactamase superfamily II)
MIDFDRAFDAVPGVPEAVSPMVRRVLCGNPGPYTFKGTSTFIVGHGTVAIIDPGPDDDAHLSALVGAVRGETVSHILVTHTHADHSPLAAKLKAATGAATAGYGPHGAGRNDGALRLDASADLDFVPDIVLGHGDRIAGKGWTLEGVFTPGHTSNHMAFALEEEQALFCGDHVMAWATSVIAPPDGNMGQYFASLKLLLGRGDQVYHPAHGPSKSDPLPLVRGFLAHRRMREEAIYGKIKEGFRTIPAIVAEIYSDVDPRLHGAAALSALAHIEHLVERGKVRAGDGADPARTYTAL